MQFHKTNNYRFEGGGTAETQAVKADGNTSGGSSDSLEGSHVFMFKSTGNSFGDLMFEGFDEYMKGEGQKAVYKSPAETTVAAQVQLLDELITQKLLLLLSRQMVIPVTMKYLKGKRSRNSHHIN